MKIGLVGTGAIGGTPEEAAADLQGMAKIKQRRSAPHVWAFLF